jgi:hypothetical protein
VVIEFVVVSSASGSKWNRRRFSVGETQLPITRALGRQLQLSLYESCLRDGPASTISSLVTTCVPLERPKRKEGDWCSIEYGRTGHGRSAPSLLPHWRGSWSVTLRTAHLRSGFCPISHIHSAAPVCGGGDDEEEERLQHWRFPFSNVVMSPCFFPAIGCVNFS